MHRRGAIVASILFTLAGCASTTVPSTTTTTSPPFGAVASPDASMSDGPLPTVRPTLRPPVGPTAELAAAGLDGLLVAPELAHRLPLAVSIDDSRAARPQSGFNGASIVWHAPADGYETRYLLVYQEGDSPDVGPVRSGRLYLAHWAAELRAALAHYGGDRVSRAWIAAHTGTLLWSIDGLGAGNRAYHRIPERRAPHNAYTSTADLRSVATRLGAPPQIDSSLVPRPFRDDSPVTDRGPAQSVSVPFNTVTIGYRYDAGSNAYRRTVNGDEQVDPADGQAVTARTVVVLFVKFRLDSTIEPGHNRPDLTDIGTGSALVFSEGRTTVATWSKTDAESPTRILGPGGRDLAFIRGQVFIEVVPKGTRVSF